MKKMICVVLTFLLFSSAVADVVEERNLSVYIEMANDFPIWEGEDVILYAFLVGDWSNLRYTFQWEISYDGKEFVPINGANSDSYIFPATKESLQVSYRLAVHIEEFD